MNFKTILQSLIFMKHRVIAAMGLLTGKFTYATVIYIDRPNLEKLLMDEDEFEVSLYCTTRPYISRRIIQAAHAALTADSMDNTLAKLQFEAETMQLAGIARKSEAPAQNLCVAFKDWCEKNAPNGYYNGRRMTNTELFKVFRENA